MPKCLVIEPTGVVWEADFSGSGLKKLQELVGGFIESVTLPQACDHWFFVNEDGRTKQLPPNGVASAICALLGMVVTFPCYNAILGTMVVCGPVNDDGEHQEIVPELRESLIDCISQLQRGV